MDEARDDIKEAEEAQLQEEGKMLDTATSGMANMVRIGIGRLFGSTLTNDEVEQVANQVEGQLKIEANKMLRTRADTITNREIDNLEGMVEEEEESGLLTDEIGADVSEQGFGAAIAVKDDIDAAAISIKDSLKARATEIEKAILEERLSAKLGKRVKLVIMDDELKVEGDDALFLGLNTLAPPATTTYENSAYPPSTVTTTGYNPYINPYVSSTAVPPATPSFGAPPVTAYGADPRSRYSVPPPRSPYDPAPTTHGSVTSPAKTYTYNKDTYGNPSYTTTTTNGAGKDYDVPGVAAPDKKEEKLGDHGDDSKDSGDWK